MRHRRLNRSVFDILDIEHSRNQNAKNYFENVIGALITYTFLDKTSGIPPYVQKMSGTDFKNGQIMIVS